MARAKRHYIPGMIWHITHRCHNRDFLLKFAKDRRSWLQWLFEAKRLRKVLGFDTYEKLKGSHKKWVEGCLETGDNFRDDKWTKSIAVGNKTYIEKE